MVLLAKFISLPVGSLTRLAPPSLIAAAASTKNQSNVQLTQAAAVCRPQVAMLLPLQRIQN